MSRSKATSSGIGQKSEARSQTAARDETVQPVRSAAEVVGRRPGGETFLREASGRGLSRPLPRRDLERSTLRPRRLQAVAGRSLSACGALRAPHRNDDSRHLHHRRAQLHRHADQPATWTAEPAGDRGAAAEPAAGLLRSHRARRRRHDAGRLVRAAPVGGDRAAVLAARAARSVRDQHPGLSRRRQPGLPLRPAACRQAPDPMGGRWSVPGRHLHVGVRPGDLAAHAGAGAVSGRLVSGQPGAPGSAAVLGPGGRVRRRRCGGGAVSGLCLRRPGGVDAAGLRRPPAVHRRRCLRSRSRGAAGGQRDVQLSALRLLEPDLERAGLLPD